MRLVDADKLKRKAQKLSTEAWKINRVAKVAQILNQFIDWIEGMPTINAVEVVRCRDCKWWQDSEVGVVECPICTRIHDMVFEMGACDYCSKGKRREDGEE